MNALSNDLAITAKSRGRAPTSSATRATLLVTLLKMCAKIRGRTSDLGAPENPTTRSTYVTVQKCARTNARLASMEEGVRAVTGQDKMQQRILTLLKRVG
jgi:hypothetical protein